MLQRPRVNIIILCYTMQWHGVPRQPWFSIHSMLIYIYIYIYTCTYVIHIKILARYTPYIDYTLCTTHGVMYTIQYATHNIRYTPRIGHYMPYTYIIPDAAGSRQCTLCTTHYIKHTRHYALPST